MPNYDDRRHNADAARRQIDRIANKPNMTRQDLDDAHKLAMIADTMERHNDREDYRYTDGEEMRRGRRRGTRSEMGDYNEEMARRGRSRYEMDERPEMRYPNMPYNPIPHAMVPYFGYPYMENQNYEEMARRKRDSRGRFTSEMLPYENYPMMNMGHGEYSESKMGFAHGSAKDDMFKEMEEYYNDYIKHKHLYEKSKSPEEKEHMKLELEELTEYVADFIKKIQRKATTPEEMNLLHKMVQKVSQKSTGGQSF